MTTASTIFESPVGPLFLEATEAGVTRVEFCDGDLPKVSAGRNRHLDQLKAELTEYFAGERTTFGVAFDYSGTEFQREVWGELCRIPFGDTWSYADLAKAVGRPLGSRAVGQANGRNHVAIVIPCHRIINAGGKLGGYGGGLWRKEWLLEHERRVLAGARGRSSS